MLSACGFVSLLKNALSRINKIISTRINTVEIVNDGH